MNKQEIKKEIAELLNTGKSKNDVYKILSDKGENTHLVAYLIASIPSTGAYEKLHKKINTLIAIMLVVAIWSALSGYITGLKNGPIFALVTVLLGTLIQLLFTYGFYKNYARAYNMYILLGFVTTPLALISITKEPIATSIGVAINLAILCFVWYLRSRLFPDFNLIGPKKIKEQYVFTS
ncbi:MAG: hypothetical protein ACXW1T_11560 [Methylophilus sp.]